MKVITFLQVVRSSEFINPEREPTPVFPPGKSKEYWEGFCKENKRNDFVDHLPDFKAPYVGAEWDEEAGTWVQRKGPVQIGWGPKAGKGEGRFAFMQDTPGRIILGTDRLYFSYFETAAVSLDTKQVLGVLEWGYWQEGDEITIFKADRSDFHLEVSEWFKAAVGRWNASDKPIKIDIPGLLPEPKPVYPPGIGWGHPGAW
jgi:hypothetical protein